MIDWFIKKKVFLNSFHDIFYFRVKTLYGVGGAMIRIDPYTFIIRNIVTLKGEGG